MSDPPDQLRRGADDISEPDRRIVAGQIGREPRALAGVAVRCVFGMPAVTRQAPVDAEGRPFPTAYYVVCPHLVRQIDRLESAGGVKFFEQLIGRDDELRTATANAHAEHASLDARGVGIAAVSDHARVKCLHAHAAFALAGHEHPLGDAVVREAEPCWCEDRYCARFVQPEATGQE